MKCALCTRSEEQVKLFNLFKHKCCGSCKTAYYRGLTRLHEYVDLRNKIKDASDLQALVWKFLCDSDFCIQKRALNLTQLCPIDLETKKKQCAHCRFRKAVLIFKALARTKLVKSAEELRVNQISNLLHQNSEEIVKFCVRKMEERLSEQKIPAFIVSTGAMVSRIQPVADSDYFQGNDCLTDFQKENKEIRPIQKIRNNKETVTHRIIDVEKLHLNKFFSSFDEPTGAIT